MKKLWQLCILILAFSPSVSFGGVRHFTFLYEAPTSAPRSLELENWVTWQRITEPDRSDEVDFRHELEYGVTDKFQVSVYLADWFYENNRGGTGFTVDDPIGTSIYGEIRAGDRLIELESKLIAQKNLGPLIFAYNATLEAVWEGNHLAERKGEFSQAVGASYEISPRISAGIELLHEFVFPEWRNEEKIRNLFVGPNISYRRGNWFVTVTALAQATDTDDEPDLQVRTIFGVGL